MSARYGTAMVFQTILKVASARYGTAIVQCRAVQYRNSSVSARYSTAIVQCTRGTVPRRITTKLNNFAKKNQKQILKKIQYQEPWGHRLMKKNGGKKSHATVPLRRRGRNYVKLVG